MTPSTLPASPWPRTRRIPNFTAFAASAAIMLVELSAGALVSRYLGMSLHTWTGIIGVVMAGMAIGNSIGGRLADRAPAVKCLAWLLFIAALGCAAILPLNTFIGGWLAPVGLAWPLRVALHVSFVFLLPSITLGAVTPVVARLALQVNDEPGKTVGAIFAWSVAGSIAGTFLTGFYLVYVFGVTQLFLGAAATLAALGLFFAIAAVRHGSSTLPEAQAAGQSNTSGPGPMLWFTAYATVFMSNALFMMFELAASRVMSKHLGASIYTWTAVIGVVLAGITLGNYLGGRLADRVKPRISTLFITASVLAFFSPLASAAMSHVSREWLWLGLLPWPAQIALHMIVAFFAPCVAIGTVSPIVVQRLLDAGARPGRSIGGVYAFGSLGAIVGTFATGYLLIDWLHSLPVLGLVTALLALVGALHARSPLPFLWAAVAAALFITAELPQEPARRFATSLGLRHPISEHAVYIDESHYSHIEVHKNPHDPSLRQMYLDNMMHGEIDLDNVVDLKYDYAWIYRGVIDIARTPGTPVSVLALGGGGFVFPHFLEKTRPGSYLEAVEIDPAVTEAAHQSFGLPRDTSVKIDNMDARNLVEDLVRAKSLGQDVPAFDCILGDTFSDFTVPRHLTTLEFARQVDSLLKPDGLYLMNLIDMLDSGLFIGAMVTTLREVFPQVEAYNTGRPFHFRDNFVVVCSKVPRDFSGLVPLLQKEYHYEGQQIDLDALLTPGRRLLITDNYAPVELLLQPVADTRKHDRGLQVFRRAMAASEANRLDEALALAERALSYGYEWPAVYELMASVYFVQGRHEERIAALRKALPDNPEPAIILQSLGVALLLAGKEDEGYETLLKGVEASGNKEEAHTTVAKLAMKGHRYDLALQQWQALAALKPQSAAAHYNIGLAHAGLQHYDEAIAAWRTSISLDPKHYDSYHNLALALHMQKRDDEARQVMQDLRAQGGAPDPKLESELQPASN